MSMREPGWRSRATAALAPVGAAGPADGADGGFIVAVSEGEADVLVLNEADGGGEGEVAGEEDGLGVADAEGAAAVEPVHEGGSDVVECEVRRRSRARERAAVR